MTAAPRDGSATRAWVGRGPDRAYPGLIAALVAGTFLVVTALRTGQPWQPIVDGLVPAGVAALAAVQCAARAFGERADRAAWACLATGLAAAAAGLAWGSLAGPGRADQLLAGDLLGLAFYPAACLGLALLARLLISRSFASMWLDGLIAVLGVSALIATIVFERLLALTDVPPTVVAVKLTYPVGDLLLLGIATCVVTVYGLRPGRVWWLLAAGLTLVTAAQSAHAYQAGPGPTTTVSVADALWPLGVALIGAAAGQPVTSSPRAPRLDGWSLIAVPGVFTLSSVALLVYDRINRIGSGGFVLAAITVVLVLVRLGMTFHEVRRLADSRRLALTDDLTGLPNRRNFFVRVGGVTEPVGARRPAAVLLIDLDRFKEVNDTHGHQVGDDLLGLAGRRLARVVRESDVTARLGGDEFGVLLLDADENRARETAQRIRQHLIRDFTVYTHRLRVDASVGIALFPLHGQDAEELLRCADVAMYAAKAAGTGVEVYDPQTDTHTPERVQLQQQLPAALDSQLELHYQPKVDLSAGTVVGVEALVRWRHPELGVLRPDTVLPLAEVTRLTGELARAVLDQALADCARWSAQGMRLSVAVNLSPDCVVDIGFPADVRTMLNKHGVSATRLVLEITEDGLLLDTIRSRLVLRDLQDYGVRISVDHFGSGFSSLAHLRDLPIDELKLDRSFVAPLARDGQTARVVASTVGFAHALGLKLVAEGVEDAAARDLLREFGCDLAQGYLYTPPLPLTDLLAWLGATATGSDHPAGRPAALPGQRQHTVRHPG